MTNIYVHQDLHEMNLYPCAYSMTFNVTQKKVMTSLRLMPFSTSVRRTFLRPVTGMWSNMLY